MTTTVEDDPSSWPIHHLARTDDDMQLYYANAVIWLHQAAAGDIPHGGVQCLNGLQPATQPKEN